MLHIHYQWSMILLTLIYENKQYRIIAKFKYEKWQDDFRPLILF